MCIFIVTHTHIFVWVTSFRHTKNFERPKFLNVSLFKQTRQKINLKQKIYDKTLNDVTKENPSTKKPKISCVFLQKNYPRCRMQLRSFWVPIFRIWQGWGTVLWAQRAHGGHTHSIAYPMATPNWHGHRVVAHWVNAMQMGSMVGHSRRGSDREIQSGYLWEGNSFWHIIIRRIFRNFLDSIHIGICILNFVKESGFVCAFVS